MNEVHVFPRRKNGQLLPGSDSPRTNRSPIILTLANLSCHFGRPIASAAAKLGVSITALKKACRKLKVLQWPKQRVHYQAGNAKDGDQVHSQDGGRSLEHSSSLSDNNSNTSQHSPSENNIVDPYSLSQPATTGSIAAFSSAVAAPPTVPRPSGEEGRRGVDGGDGEGATRIAGTCTLQSFGCFVVLPARASDAPTETDAVPLTQRKTSQRAPQPENRSADLHGNVPVRVPPPPSPSSVERLCCSRVWDIANTAPEHVDAAPSSFSRKLPFAPIRSDECEEGFTMREHEAAAQTSMYWASLAEMFEVPSEDEVLTPEKVARLWRMVA